MASQVEEFTIVPAKESEVALVLAFIKELADYERLSHLVTATELGLKDALFGPRPSAEVLLSTPSPPCRYPLSNL